MKRSEMVVRIKKVIDAMGNDHGSERLAREILRSIEHIGMQPPAVWFDHETDDKELANRWEKELITGMKFITMHGEQESILW